MQEVSEWNQQVHEYLRLAYEIGNSSLIHKYRRSILDACLRGASDIISCENTNINNNTQSMIQWCLRWTNEAMDKYWLASKLLTVTRAGKPPTTDKSVMYVLIMVSAFGL